MVPSADDVERSLRRLKTLNSTAQALLRSCEDMAKEYKSTPLLSTLDSVNFLLTESGKSLETLEWDLISSPPSDEGGEPLDIAETADLLCRYLQLPEDKKALVIAEAREPTLESERDEYTEHASWNQRQQQLSSSSGSPRYRVIAKSGIARQ